MTVTRLLIAKDIEAEMLRWQPHGPIWVGLEMALNIVRDGVPTGNCCYPHPATLRATLREKHARGCRNKRCQGCLDCPVHSPHAEAADV